MWAMPSTCHSIPDSKTRAKKIILVTKEGNTGVHKWGDLNRIVVGGVVVMSGQSRLEIRKTFIDDMIHEKFQSLCVVLKGRNEVKAF